MSEILEKKESWLDRRVWYFNWEQTIYILLIVLAIASRFVLLGLRVQSHDESLHTRYSWELYDGQGFEHTPLMHGPFLFHATALSYWMFGDSDASARVPVALLGVVLVAMPYLLRRQLGRVGALVTSFLFLISPSLLYYSRYIRHDIPVIVWSMIVVACIWAYLKDRRDRYLYWFAGALSLMFATKEVAFLYVAILGSFVAIRMLVGLLSAQWEAQNLRGWFQIGLIGVLLGILVFAAGMAGQGVAEKMAQSAALDPAATAVDAATISVPGEEWTIVQVIGGAIIAISMLLAIVAAFLGMKRRLHAFAEFDFVILFSTLLLPFMAPILIQFLGWDPLDYSNAGIVHSLIVLVPLLAISVTVGLWWDWRRWLGAAGIFYAIFAVLFTTVFTNGRGFATGWIGSLGYWLVQQDVQRGGQPWYFYLWVVPIYELLPILGTAAAVLLWGIVDKGFALVGKLFAQRCQVSEEDRSRLFGFVPFAIYWTVMTWIVYSYSGEKMGWLTVHFALPMILLAGWFLGRLLQAIDWKSSWQKGSWALVLLLPLLLAALGLGVKPLLSGGITLDSQQLDNLIALGRVLGGLVVAVGAGYALVHAMAKLNTREVLGTLSLAGFALLAVFTIRTAWRASYINYDNAKEYLVYAHGGRGTKEVMEQIKDISMRLYGDLSIRVSFDNDSSWPFWWYLRNYPNKVYYGENPSRDSFDVPVAVVGDQNWSKVEPYVGNRFYVFEYTFVQWPMEDYKGLTWERIWGALSNPSMRSALWDIVINRDYTRYGEVTGRDFSLAKWPLRHQLRFYVRKDVAAQLWDYGVGPSAEDVSLADPYEQNFQADLLPITVIGSLGSGPGQLQSPRGIDIGPDGLLYVTDAGNHRVQVYDTNGQFVRGWGGHCDVATGAGACAGQFNEPWGIAVAADGTVYVADTWNHRIQRFSSEGVFLSSWGKLGQVGPGQSAGEQGVFYGPRDIAVGPDGTLYVTDTGNKRIQVFDAEGRYLGEFGEGGPLDGQFDEPVGLDVGLDGKLYVADTWNGRITVYDQSHTMEHKWPVEAWYGQSVNNKPYLDVAPDGRVFITDPELYRVLVFDSQGTYLSGFGQYGTAMDGMALPTGIVVGGDGTVYVVDAANNRVLGYQPSQ